MILQFHCCAFFQRKKNMLIKKDICVPMFIAAVLTVAMVQKELKCSLMNE